MSLNQSSQNAVLSTDILAVFTSDPLGQSTIIKCSVLNTDSVAHSVTVYRVGPGGEPTDDGAMMIKNLAVAANTTVVLPISGQVFFGGQSLQASADANSVINLNLSVATNV